MILRLLSFAAAAAVAISACSSPPAAPVLTDPKDILTRSLTSLSQVKTVHLKGELGGQVKIDVLGTGNPTSLNLQGTTADADVDMGGEKAHLEFAAPAVLVTADFIQIGDVTYAKIPMLGPRYQKIDSSILDLQSLLDDLQEFVDTPGVAPTRQADERCGDKDCYRVSLSLTADELNSATGNVLSSAAPNLTGTVDVWVQKTDLRPAKVAINGNAGDMGNVTMTVTLSNYDAAVTVNPPPDSEIEAPAAS